MVKKALLIISILVAIDIALISCCGSNRGKVDVMYSSLMYARTVDVADTSKKDTAFDLAILDTCTATRFSIALRCADSIAARYKLTYNYSSLFTTRAYACKLAPEPAETKDRINDISLKPLQNYNSNVGTNTELSNNAQFLVYNLDSVANKLLPTKTEAIAFINNYFNKQIGYKGTIGRAIPSILIIPNEVPNVGSTNTFSSTITLANGRKISDTTSPVEFK
jgi:hypothetical protein